VGASLVALAVAPLVADRQTREIRSEINDVLEPTRTAVAELESVLARQMVALQAYLLSGEARFRQAYFQALAENEEIQARLNELTRSEVLDLGDLQSDVYTLSFQWYEPHAAALNGLVPRTMYMRSLPDNQARYDRVLQAAMILDEAVAREVRRGQARMQEATDRQLRITIALVGLALLATLVVAVLARLLRGLAVEADVRRREAVRVRREIDAVLEATGEGVLGVDLEGLCTFLNRAGADLLGVAPRAALGRDLHDLVHGGPEGLRCDPEDCPVPPLLAGREPTRLLHGRFWRHDGTSFPVQLEVRPMLDGRRLRGAVLTFIDLTDVRRAERALRQAVAARDEMVAVVSHDLRGPVGTINSAAQLLLDVPMPEEQWREHVRAIERSSGRLGGLIKDLLDVARIEAGVLSVFGRPHPVEALVDEALTLARVSARQRGVTIARTESGAALPLVVADRPRVLQVFSNLLDNAIRHSPTGGRVVVGTEIDGPEVVISVRDEGPGIPEDQLARVFDRFRQLEGGGRTGAGLGLAIVKGVVEAHGGRVWVESRSGAGSTFFFTLAVAEEGGEVERQVAGGGQELPA
jgi:PAS domain S-box-containing protein